MSILVILAICSGVNDPIVAETPARAFQLFARQTRLSELLDSSRKSRTSDVQVVGRRSMDPVTEVALRLADEQLQLALFQMRYSHSNPYVSLQRDRVQRLTLALTKLEQSGLVPNRDRVIRELEAMAVTTLVQRAADHLHRRKS